MRQLTEHRSSITLWLVFIFVAANLRAGFADDVELSATVDPERTTSFTCTVSIAGKLITPGPSDDAEWGLRSAGRFRFLQRQLESPFPGPTGLRAIRKFSEAATDTLVGDDHRTQNQLPLSHRLLHVYGSDSTLRHVSPDVRLARKHVDLLQLPCDPLAVAGLLPTRSLASTDEKWNADAWVLPTLVGLDGVVNQTVTCSVSRVTDTVALIDFQGSAEGAVAGAAVNAELSGSLTLNRVDGIISEFSATLKEKRSAGVVSPGLNVTAEVRWSQNVADDDSLKSVDMPMDQPEASRLLLTLSTPWRLALLHNRSWYVFHETADLVMLRLLSNGALIGQCNIAPAPTVVAGESTSEQQWQQDVSTALATRGGVITASKVSQTEAGWRIHHVRATSRTSPPEDANVVAETLLWDYYLCTWKTGEQFSLAFTHTKSDDERFGTAAEDILKTLVVRPISPKVPLPR